MLSVFSTSGFSSQVSSFAEQGKISSESYHLIILHIMHQEQKRMFVLFMAPPDLGRTIEVSIWSENSPVKLMYIKTTSWQFSSNTSRKIFLKMVGCVRRITNAWRNQTWWVEYLDLIRATKLSSYRIRYRSITKVTAKNDWSYKIWS